MLDRFGLLATVVVVVVAAGVVVVVVVVTGCICDCHCSCKCSCSDFNSCPFCMWVTDSYCYFINFALAFGIQVLLHLGLLLLGEAWSTLRLGLTSIPAGRTVAHLGQRTFSSKVVVGKVQHQKI